MALAPVATRSSTVCCVTTRILPTGRPATASVLSCGHASMLLYATFAPGRRQASRRRRAADRGPAISLDQIKHFRQLHSPCAGHPERGEASGIETTTGPLGQGLGQRVAWHRPALAGGTLYPARLRLFGYDIYALCRTATRWRASAPEAASGPDTSSGQPVLDLRRQQITIEAKPSWLSAKTSAGVFEGYRWHVFTSPTSTTWPRSTAPTAEFQATDDRPTLVIRQEHIGYGAPHKQDTHHAPRFPLGDD